MTTTVKVRFLWGRFHATPWGSAVNEARAEWPPSQWRLLRALYAIWKEREPELSTEQVWPVLEALAEPAEVFLPPHTLGHSRHYLPGADHFTVGKTSTSLVLDPFVAVPKKASVGFRWDNELDAGGRQILSTLLGHLRYFGRAESACEAELADDADDEVVGTPGRWVTPGKVSPGEERVEVLVPQPPLVEAQLIKTPMQTRQAGYLVPDGARLVAFPKIEEFQPGPTETSPTRPPVESIRFVLNPIPPVPMRKAAKLGQILRKALMAQYGTDPVPDEITGRRKGQVLSEDHTHAHFLPIPGRLPKGPEDVAELPIKALVVWAPAGLRHEVLDRAANVRRLWGIGDVIQVAVEGSGSVQETAPELVADAGTDGRLWQSLTPFAPSRHYRKSRDGTWEEYFELELRNEAGHRGVRVAEAVQIAGPWLRYDREKLGSSSGNGRAKARAVGGFRIRLDEPVVGRPLTIGALSHYGLGVFLPVSE